MHCWSFLILLIGSYIEALVSVKFDRLTDHSLMDTSLPIGIVSPLALPTPPQAIFKAWKPLFTTKTCPWASSCMTNPCNPWISLNWIRMNGLEIIWIASLGPSFVVLWLSPKIAFLTSVVTACIMDYNSWTAPRKSQTSKYSFRISSTNNSYMVCTLITSHTSILQKSGFIKDLWISSKYTIYDSLIKTQIIDSLVKHKNCVLLWLFPKLMSKSYFSAKYTKYISNLLKCTIEHTKILSFKH